MPSSAMRRVKRQRLAGLNPERVGDLVDTTSVNSFRLGISQPDSGPNETDVDPGYGSGSGIESQPASADASANSASPFGMLIAPPVFEVVEVPETHVGVRNNIAESIFHNDAIVNEDSDYEFDEEDDNADDSSEDSEDLPDLGVRLAADRSDFTVDERCMLELMDLLDSSGAPRYLYDRVIRMVKKHLKRGFNYRRAKQRDKVMAIVREKMSIPEPVSVPVGNSQVIKFPFLEMVTDLLTSDVFADPANLCVNKDPSQYFDIFQPPTSDKVNEVLATPWYVRTCQKLVVEPELDFVIPLILYTDRTGTDALQRYSLEPWLFTTPLLRRTTREMAKSWRHLGFTPKIHGNSDGAEGCRMYHEFLNEILAELKAAQRSPPLLHVQIGSSIKKRRCHFPVIMVEGDQLSQDKLCCRVVNNAGGASRCHRGCMCSFLDAGNPDAVCRPVNEDTINQLNGIAVQALDKDHASKLATELMDPDHNYPHGSQQETKNCTMFAKMRAKIATVLLAKPFQTHPCINAFDGLDLGVHSSIREAAADDVMHATEGGQLKESADSTYDGITKTEKAKVEGSMMKCLKQIRTSSRDTFPRWRLSPGFSNQTNMTCEERAGSMLQLALGLHNPELYSLLETAHTRQRKDKYNKFKKLSPDSKLNGLSTAESRRRKISAAELVDVSKDFYPDQFDFYFKNQICDLSVDEVRKILTIIERHGFNTEFVTGLDKLQLAQMFTELMKQKVDQVKFPQNYPSTNTPGLYTAKRNTFKVSLALAKKTQKILTSPLPSRDNSPTLEGDDVVEKHRRKKPKLGADGQTCAILAPMSEYQRYCEYALMYHGWCHYGHLLSDDDRCDKELIDFGSRLMLRYFDFLVYRGDSTLDTSTCKTHTLVRNGTNNQVWGSLMNTSCHLGERLLKTHAKGAARTAQRRGEETYTFQTAQRAMEQLTFARALEQVNSVPSADDDDDLSVEPSLVSYRRRPFFDFSRENPTVVSISSKGKRTAPNRKSGNLPDFLVRALLELEPEANSFTVWNEIKLRHGKNYVRAHPNYHQTGGWYDWVRCKFVIGEDEEEVMYPARVLCFYKTELDTSMKAVVHSVLKKMLTEKEDKHLGDTNLCTHYRTEYKGSLPALIDVPVDAIDRTILAMPSYKGLVPIETRVQSVQHQQTVMVLLPRSVWAKGFIEVTRELRRILEENETEGNTYPSLCRVNIGLDLLSHIE